MEALLKRSVKYVVYLVVVAVGALLVLLGIQGKSAVGKTVTTEGLFVQTAHADVAGGDNQGDGPGDGDAGGGDDDDDGGDDGGDGGDG